MGGQAEKEGGKHICMGLLAHVDAGKTTLSEGILFLTGEIRRVGRVDKGDAFLDTYHLERERGITIFSKQAVFPLGDRTVTLLDTPGHVDFSAEMERTLQVLDCAVLLVSGADGVQGHTETLWRLLKRYQIPTLIFVNKMDQAGTDRKARMEELKRRLDEGCVDLGAEGQTLNLGTEEWLALLTQEQRESMAVCGEASLEEYLETGGLQAETVRRLVKQRRLFPCFFGSALKLTGVEALLSGIENLVPAPRAGQEFGARVFKISRDAQGNRLTHMKITGGTLRVKEELGSTGEKVNQIRIYSGNRYQLVSQAGPGTVCAVTGPVSTHPGQGMGGEAESWIPVLEPVLTCSLELPEDCDPHKMLQNLRQLEDEDPELHLVWDGQNGKILVQIMGEVQTEILRAQIWERFQTEVGFGPGSIVYKETILEPVEGVGHFEPLRHYAEVHLLMEPGERGSGLQFETRCSEELLEGSWQRLVLTHLEEKTHRGVLTGAAITDMKITLAAGRAHQKHTEGGDFRQATYRAVRQGLCQARCALLEPWYFFSLRVPAENVGRAMADLERMQGKFSGPEPEGEEMALTGTAPVAAMRDYQKELAAYTRGKGRLSCRLDGYFPCRDQEKLVQASGYDPEADLDNPSGSVFCAHGAGFVVPWYEVKRWMHVETPAFVQEKLGQAGGEKNAALKEAGAAPEKGRGRTAAPSSAFGADDKELEAIFTRTYGESRRRLPLESGPRQVVFQEKERPAQSLSVPSSMGRPGYEAQREPEYLLVDGYNIIYAWDELRDLARTTIDGARHRLMDILCNYQPYRACTLIVVFDAYKVAGNLGSVQSYHNIHVVYTKEAETADQYIEKLAHQMGRSHHVTVATSDGLEQLIIRGQGCLLMSAKDLREDVERVAAQIQEDRERMEKPGKNYVFQNLDRLLKNTEK